MKINKKLNTKLIRIVFAVSAVGVVYCGCLDRLVLDIDEDLINNIVVQGKLLKTDSSCQLDVTTTTAYTFGTPLSIDANSVVIENESGVQLALARYATGKYRLTFDESISNFPIIDGAQYRLLIEAPDGDQIESSFETMPPPPPNVSISFEVFNKERTNPIGQLFLVPHIRFLFDTPTRYSATNEPIRYLFLAKRHYRIQDYLDQICYPFSLTEVTLGNPFNGAEYNASDITYTVQEEFIGFEFAFSYAFLLDYETISEEAYNYFVQANRLIAPSEDVFREPAAKIRGNLKNMTHPDEDVYGFFYAAQMDSLILFVDSSDVGCPEELCSDPPPPFGPALICGDCTLLADTVKPFYIID